jgi:hypothetical protein
MPLIPQSWQVPEVFRRRLGEDAGRQRVMAAEGHLLVILHAPPRPDQDERVGRLFWRAPDGVWTPKGITHGDLALGDLLGEYEKVVDRLDSAEDVATAASDHFAILTELTPLVRSTHNLHSALQEARQSAPDDRRLLVLRDRAYNLARRCELLQADAKQALDFVIARRAEEQSASSRRMEVASHRLNLLAAFFFPLATVAAVLGMNLKHGLEPYDTTGSPVALLAVLGAGLLFGAILTLFVTKR